jgi:putative restriction endonuclease
MTRDELLAQLAGLRQARVGQVRVPHKPLLLLWLFGQFAATGSSSRLAVEQAIFPILARHHGRYAIWLGWCG